MKKLLIGILALTSISAFAECTLNPSGNGLSPRMLSRLSKKYILTNGDSRFYLRIQSMCDGVFCDVHLGVRTNQGDQAYTSAYGSSRIFGDREETAILSAIRKLDSCL